MKHKFAKILLSTCLCTALSMSVCACSFPNVFGGKDESKDEETDDDEKAEDDEDVDSAETGNGGAELIDIVGEIGTPVNNFPSVEQPASGPSEGPGYLIVTERKDNEVHLEGYDQSEFMYDGKTDYIYITSSGYEPLKEAIAQYDEDVRLKEEEAYSEFEELDAILVPLGSMYTDTFGYLWTSVYRDDSYVFSIDSFYTAFISSPHMDNYEYGISYNTQTGEVISLRDYVTDYDYLCDIAVNELAEMNNDVYYGGFYEGWEDTVYNEFNNESVCWVATDDGLTLFFNYDLTGYVYGMVSMDVTVYDYPGLFVDEYYPAGEETPAPECRGETPYISGMLNDIAIPLSSGICREWYRMDTDDYSYEKWLEIIKDSDYYKNNTSVTFEFDGSSEILIEDEQNNCSLVCRFSEYNDGRLDSICYYVDGELVLSAYNYVDNPFYEFAFYYSDGQRVKCCDMEDLIKLLYLNSL